VSLRIRVRSVRLFRSICAVVIKSSIWSTANDFALDCFKFTRTISLSTFFGSPVVFDFPTIINVGTKNKFDDWKVNTPAVRRKLETSRHAITQAANKFKRGFRVTLAKCVSSNQFMLCDGKEGPLVAVIGMLIRLDTALLFLDKCPRFVDLYLRCANVSQFTIKNAFGFLASDAQDFKNGFRVDTVKSCGCSDSASFSEARQNAIDSFLRNVKRVADSLGLREGLATTRAFESRRVSFAVASVYVWLAVASLWAFFHGILSSFLTGITVGPTIRLRALSGINGVSQVMSLRGASNTPSDSRLVPVAGLEPATFCLVGSRSFHLSYTGISKKAGSAMAPLESSILLFLIRCLQGKRRFGYRYAIHPVGGMQCCVAQPLKRTSSRGKWLRNRTIDEFPLALSYFDLFGFGQPFQGRMNRREHVAVLGYVIAHCLESVPNLNRGDKGTFRLQSLTHSIRQSSIGTDEIRKQFGVFLRKLVSVGSAKDRQSEETFPKLKDALIEKLSLVINTLASFHQDRQVFQGGFECGFVVGHRGG
jgi:hypothetical protein